MTLAVLCSGQGTQHSAMFDLLAGYPSARETLAQIKADAAFDAPLAAHNAPDIFQNTLAQPLICAYQLATWAAIAPILPRPALFAGYSVGELAAYGCAGSLPAAGVILLAQQRARAMDDAATTPSGLTAVRGLTHAKVEELCSRNTAAIAIVNGPEHFIVGGTIPALDHVDAQAIASGGLVSRLRVSVAAHTHLLASATPRFRGVLEASPFTSPAQPVLAGVSGAAVQDRETAIAVLSRQISTTVQWASCLEAAQERGCRVFLELGPGDALARIARELFPQLAIRSITDFRGVDGAAAWVSKNL